MRIYMFQVGNARPDQLFARLSGEERYILRYHEQVQRVAAGGRLLHQVAVAQGEGVGVHHDGADDGPFGQRRPVQRLDILFKAMAAVFQEDHFVQADDLIKTQAGEILRGLLFCVDKQVVLPS